MLNRSLKLAIISMMTASLVFFASGSLVKVAQAGDSYVYFPQDSIYFNEDDGLEFIPYVSVVGGSFGPTAYLSVTDISAVFGTDYHINASKVSPRNSGTYSLMTIILEDTLIESDEQYLLTFTSGDFLHDPANGCYGSCIVTIVDNDTPDPPDNCILTSSSMSPPSGSITAAGGISFDIMQTVEITDTSTAGLGWELILNIDDMLTLAVNSIDDPCLLGTSGYIQAEIPTEASLDSIILTSLQFPDNTIDDTDFAADLTNIQSSDGIYSIKVAEDDSGVTGIYTASIMLSISFDEWLPVGTVITAGGNGSRFDDDPSDVNFNEHIVQTGDMIQIFAGIYKCNFEYDAVRPSAP